MRIPTERLADIEERLSAIEGDIEIAAALPIRIMATVLDDLVDQHLLPSDTRERIWDAVRRETVDVGARSRSVERAIKRALPQKRAGITDASAPHRVPKPLLRGPKP